MIKIYEKNHLLTKIIFWLKNKILGPQWKFQISQNLIFVQFSATLGQKYAKFGWKSYWKTLIYREILEKFPLWADLSKSALQIIFKNIFLINSWSIPSKSRSGRKRHAGQTGWFSEGVSEVGLKVNIALQGPRIFAWTAEKQRLSKLEKERSNV